MTDSTVKEFLHHYEECKKRVEAKGSGACSEYYYDFFHALDKCVSGGGGGFQRCLALGFRGCGGARARG